MFTIIILYIISMLVCLNSSYIHVVDITRGNRLTAGGNIGAIIGGLIGSILAVLMLV